MLHRPTAQSLLQELKRHLLEVSDLSAVAEVLGWDQATYMPPGGASARARQASLISTLVHEKFVSAQLGQLLDKLETCAGEWPDDSDEACLVRVARRDFEKARKVSAQFVARASAAASASYDAWLQARPQNDFAALRPHLERAIELAREYAQFFAPWDHVADPFIDTCDEGLTTAAVRTLFAELRHELLPLVEAVTAQPPADDRCLHGRCAEPDQIQFCSAVVARIGYDLTRGRVDKTSHPFCTKFAPGDVRITTRVDENDIGQALFSMLHEAGHGLYEQGVAARLEGRLGSGASSGIHESQSRLWENIVGRSRGFWRFHFPLLQNAFPQAFGDVPLDAFYRAINKVQRSLIRTDADELTYNLHIMLRFELETEMLEGRLAAQHLPERWREAMREALGVAPDDDRDGCMQDVHWYSGGVGAAFHSYTIGNILSAQFYAAAVQAHPEIPADIERGEFDTLHAWLRTNIYQHGRKFPAGTLIERASGSPLTIEPYIRYLKTKFGELYGLPLAS